MIKKIIPSVVILTGLGLIVLSFLPIKQDKENSEENIAPLITKPQEVSNTDPLPQSKPLGISKKIISPEVKNISISLVVRNATSTLHVPENSSVYEAMNILASTTDFKFHSIHYSGMGYYVDEINGEKNRNNAFWIYYVNGNQANVGISNYILKNGDIIIWRLEDSAKKEVSIK